MLRFQGAPVVREKSKKRDRGPKKGSEVLITTTHGVVREVNGILRFPDGLEFTYVREEADVPAHWHARYKGMDLHLRDVEGWAEVGLDPSEGTVFLEKVTGRVEIKGRTVSWSDEDQVREYLYLNIFPFENGQSVEEEVILWTNPRRKGQDPSDTHTRIGPVSKGANVYLRHHAR
ncbi:hypothetical protein D6783_05690 [Candidatus Woesearchaeota archaeon]|nr:MAG: hypothetical protein D6783_05690 [Candidatus Woesearchaeota archaeon]